jgi:protein SCO1/2
MIRLLALWLALAGAALATELPGDSVYQVADSWHDQNGKLAHLKDFSGRYLLVAMIYTHCKDICPMTVESMRRIEADWRAKSAEPLELLLISFDANRDRPEVLKAFAASHALPAKNWTLLQGDNKAVRRLAAVLGINYQKLENGDFNHSNMVTLLGKDGQILDQETGSEADSAAILGKLTRPAESHP